MFHLDFVIHYHPSDFLTILSNWLDGLRFLWPNYKQPLGNPIFFFESLSNAINQRKQLHFCGECWRWDELWNMTAYAVINLHSKYLLSIRWILNFQFVNFICHAHLNGYLTHFNLLNFFYFDFVFIDNSQFTHDKGLLWKKTQIKKRERKNKTKIKKVKKFTN